jgi:hypothetical protein
MPRTSRSNRRRTQRTRRRGAFTGPNMDSIPVVMRFAGRYVFSDSGSYAFNDMPLNPLNMDNRLLAVSDSFDLFRFVKVQVRFLQSNNYITTAGATSNGLISSLAYNPDVSNTPGSLQEMVNQPLLAVGNGLNGDPQPRLRLSRKLLGLNAPKWFRRGTSYDQLLQTQGQIFYGQSQNLSTSAVSLLVEYVVELGCPNDPALTLSESKEIPDHAFLCMHRPAPVLVKTTTGDLDLAPLFRAVSLEVLSQTVTESSSSVIVKHNGPTVRDAPP